MAGRPTKLTPELADELVVLLAAGVPVGHAARAVGVSRWTLARWMRDGLRKEVEQARAEGPEVDARAEARLVALVTRAAQGDWQAAAWWLERHYPERWSPQEPPPYVVGGLARRDREYV
jgi:Helix-turn-helix domain of resolvase